MDDYSQFDTVGSKTFPAKHDPEWDRLGAKFLSLPERLLVYRTNARLRDALDTSRS